MSSRAQSSRLVAYFFVLLVLPNASFAQLTVERAIELPTAAPEDVGMSSQKLQAVDDVMQDYVDDGKMVGGIVMVARKGKVCFFEDYGLADRERGVAMRKDSILRFYSMTKAITTTAALMLHDAGKLDVNDPVSKYIPQIKEAKTFVDGKLQPTTKTMTVADLMRHTSGLTYGWSEGEFAKLHNKADPINRDITLEEMEDRLKHVPLAFEPSTGWIYGISTDVLGRVVEVASGKTLEAFFREHLFEPLDMRDTGFHVPKEKRSRFAACYTAEDLKAMQSQTDMYLNSPAFKSGGGGLVSTARDYMRFLMMIQQGGTLHGRRYLKPDTVKLMTTSQLPDGVSWISFGDEVREGVGFSFGFSIREEMSDWDPGGRVGEYGWGGAASTHYWISPKDELIVITLEQVMPYRWLTEFGVKKLVYDAITN